MSTEYLAAPHPTLRQGDIVLAPSAFLVPADPAASPDLPEPPAVLGDRSRSLAWRPGKAEHAPDVAVETEWRPVLVVSHDCQLEKDFNERVRALIAEGAGLDDARSMASDDPLLDRWAVVAPLVAYDKIPAHRHAGIRAGDRIGYFALDALPGANADLVVDLGRLATVDVRLLPQSRKVASLAPTSAAELRYKLAEAYALRDLSVIRELESMAGRRILRAEALPKSKKKSALLLHLDDGGTMHLEVRRPRDELPEEITRLPGGG